MPISGTKGDGFISKDDIKKSQTATTGGRKFDGN